MFAPQVCSLACDKMQSKCLAAARLDLKNIDGQIPIGLNWTDGALGFARVLKEHGWRLVGPPQR